MWFNNALRIGNKVKRRKFFIGQLVQKMDLLAKEKRFDFVSLLGFEKRVRALASTKDVYNVKKLDVPRVQRKKLIGIRDDSLFHISCQRN